MSASEEVKPGIPKEIVKNGHVYTFYNFLGPDKNNIYHAWYTDETGKLVPLADLTDPWFLKSLSDAFSMGMGKFMHSMPTSSYKDGNGNPIAAVGHQLAGLLQTLEQWGGQVWIGNVAGEHHRLLQDIHEAAEELTHGRISEKNAIGFLKRNSVTRTIGLALWSGHVAGLTRVQTDLVNAGRGDELIGRMLDTVGSQADTAFAVINTLYATLPSDEARAEVQTIFAPDARWQRIVNFKGYRTVPEPFAKTSLPIAGNLIIESLPDVNTHLLQLLHPFIQAEAATTAARIDRFLTDGSVVDQASAEVFLPAQQLEFAAV